MMVSLAQGIAPANLRLHPTWPCSALSDIFTPIGVGCRRLSPLSHQAGETQPVSPPIFNHSASE